MSRTTSALSRAVRGVGVGPALVALVALGAGGATAMSMSSDNKPLPATAPSAQPAADQGLDAAPGVGAAAAPAPQQDGARTQEAVAPGAPAPAAAAPVAPLGKVQLPDLVVTARGPLTPEQLQALTRIKGVEAVTALDVAQVKIAGKPASIVGVDPSTFRAFTPQQTAASDPLWGVVARGEMAVSYGLSQARKLELGSTIDVAPDGAPPAKQRIGAFAVLGLPAVDGVVNRSRARDLGAQPSSVVVLSGPSRPLTALQAAVTKVVGDGARIERLRPPEVAPSTPSTGKPRSYRELYMASTRYCPGLHWSILAAIGQVESGHGKNLGPSSAGALGPMQFMPATWAYSGVDGDGDGKKDIMNPFDAVPAAARYLCRAGATRGEQGLYDAIFAYNHADWYVRKILAVAEGYRRQG